MQQEEPWQEGAEKRDRCKHSQTLKEMKNAGLKQ